MTDPENSPKRRIWLSIVALVQASILLLVEILAATVNFSWIERIYLCDGLGVNLAFL
jgi:hypothetical protein